MASTTDQRGEDSTPERLRAKNPFEFFGQVRQEARRVTWATRQEVIAATIMVFIMVAVATIFFAVIDGLISFLVQTFLV